VLIRFVVVLVKLVSVVRLIRGDPAGILTLLLNWRLVHGGDVSPFRITHERHKRRRLQVHRVREHRFELHLGLVLMLLLLHVVHLLVRLLHHFLTALNLVVLLLIPILTVDRVSVVVIFKHHVFLILHLVGVHIAHEA